MKARPLCGVCARPVDAFEEREDAWGGLVFTARCHGDVESVTVTADELAAVKSIDLTTAFAGCPRRLA